MIKRIKYFNLGQIITNILLIGVVICLGINQTKFSFNLYWLLSTLLILCNVYFISKWSNRGKEIDIDKNKSKEVTRSFNDITAVMLVFYGLVFLGIQFVEFFDESIRTNLYVALGFYALTIVFQLFCFIAVDKAVKETKKLVDKNFSNKK